MIPVTLIILMTPSNPNNSKVVYDEVDWFFNMGIEVCVNSNNIISLRVLRYVLNFNNMKSLSLKIHVICRVSHYICLVSVHPTVLVSELHLLESVRFLIRSLIFLCAAFLLQTLRDPLLVYPRTG